MVLQAVSEIFSYKVQANDGYLGGYISDLLFDDESWKLRYFVLRKNDWLQGRSMLVEPLAIAALDPEQRLLHLRLSWAYVQDSPTLRDHPPIYLQRQAELNLQPPLWSAYGGVYDPAFAPIYYTIQERLQREQSQEDEDYIRRAPFHYDVHMRSVAEICHYTLATEQGTLAHVADLLLNDETWHFDTILIETGHWFSRQQSSILTASITHISWKHQRIMTTIAQKQRSSHAAQNERLSN